MLNGNDLSKYFWANVVSNACYVLNRVLTRPIFKLTPYEGEHVLLFVNMCLWLVPP